MPTSIPRTARAALVIGSDTRSFLAVVRSLGRAGITVEVAGAPAHAPALRSRYVQRVHSIRPHDVDRLHALLVQRHFDLVIPCEDVSMVAFQGQRRRFEGIARVSLLNDEAFDVCSNKDKTHRAAASYGIPVPAQRRARTVADIEAAASEFGWPLVLKPPTSVSEDQPGRRHLVVTIRNRAQVPVLDADVLVQQHVTGIGVGVDVLCDDGEVLVAFQHERVHEPPAGGGSSYRRSVPLSPALLDAVRRLMRGIGYTGVGMVEFKVNPRTGAWVLIEVNGRFWGSLPLSIAAGADFPLYLFEMLTAGRRDFPQHYSTGVYARNWASDARWAARNLLSNRRDPTLLTRPLWRLPLEILNWPREHSDTLTRDDPAPAWAELSGVVRSAVRPALDRGRARRALKQASHILFVCRGNICRSPFAEHYLRARVGPGVMVESAGYLPPFGRPSSPEAVAAAREFGVDLVPHRSRLIDEAQVARADVILVFDQDNHDEVRGWFPAAVSKLHYLAPLAGRPWIADPGESHAGQLRLAYRRIAAALDAAPRELVTAQQGAPACF